MSTTHHMPRISGHAEAAEPHRSLRRVWFALAATGLALIAVGHCLLVRSIAPRASFFDEDRYQLYADNLVHRGFYGDEAGKWPATAEFRSVSYSAYVPPGYVFFLAPFRAVSSDPARAVRLAQALLVGVAVVATCYTGERAFGPLAGLTGGAALIATGVMANYSSFGLSEVLAATTLIVSLWLALIASDRRSWRWLLASGAVFGYSILVRPQVLLLPPALLVWLYIVWGRRRDGWIAVAAFAAGLVLVVSPWTVRNAVQLHAFVPVSTYTWINFWLVNHPGTDGLFHRPEADIGLDEVTRIRALPEVAQDSTWRRMALSWVRAHPGAAVRGWVRNGRRFVTDPDHLMQRWYALDGRTPPRLDDRWLFGAAAFTLLLAAGLRKLTAPAVLLALVAVYFSAFFCLFLPTPRFRVGLLPVLGALSAGFTSIAVNAVRVRLAGRRGIPAA